MENKIKDIANFIKESINGLQDEIATNYRYMLDDRLAIFIGWSGGYGKEKQDYIIQSKNNLDYAINVGVKVWTSDDLWTDFDYLNYPYFENGDVLDYGFAISQENNYIQVASGLIDYYKQIKDYKMDKSGKIIENVENMGDIE